MFEMILYICATTVAHGSCEDYRKVPLAVVGAPTYETRIDCQTEAQKALDGYDPSKIPANKQHEIILSCEEQFEEVDNG